MDYLSTAQAVLEADNQPLHFRDIARRAIEQRPGRNNPDKRHIDRGLISLILSIEEGAR